MTIGEIFYLTCGFILGAGVGAFGHAWIARQAGGLEKQAVAKVESIVKVNAP